MTEQTPWNEEKQRLYTCKIESHNWKNQHTPCPYHNYKLGLGRKLRQRESEKHSQARAIKNQPEQFKKLRELKEK